MIRKLEVLANRTKKQEERKKERRGLFSINIYVFEEVIIKCYFLFKSKNNW